MGLCEEKDHSERRGRGGRDNGGEQQLETGSKWIRTGGTETETETETQVDPKRCKIFLLPFMTFSQEQSQEEDAKDCTGQISKPVSQDLCRILI